MIPQPNHSLARSTHKTTTHLLKNKDYLFTSKRLGFRQWTAKDRRVLEVINTDTEVMKHFPKTLTKEENKALFERLKQHFSQRQYTYFATEILATQECIGFIGLAYQDYPTAFTPAVDIGWRLKKSAWGKGYATEGAQKCLAYGFQHIGLDEIISTCTVDNTKSEKVMKKIGMKKIGVFRHPNLSDFPKHEECLAYRIQKTEWVQHTPQ